MSHVKEGDWHRVIDDAIDRHFEEMLEVRRHLHRFPEPSDREYETSQFLMDRLAPGVDSVHWGPGNRGLYADGVHKSGPRIGLRADIDALLIQDVKDVPYKSRIEGVMHACGHDGHTACVFGAVLGLSAVEREMPWPVPWRAIFQPAEETNRGALEMIDQGALDGVGAMISLHMDPSREVGTIGVREGAFTADCCELEIDVHGRGAHAARPHESCDPIAAAAQLISSIYLFVPRSTDSQDPVVVTFGQIFGGHNSNVIPDLVVVRGTLRTLDKQVTQDTVQHLERLARGVAEASGTTIEIRRTAGPPSVINDPEMTRLVERIAGGILGSDNVQSIPRASMGGEDFAQYLVHIPGTMFRLGCVADPLTAPRLHSPGFDLDERSLVIGAKILARSAIEWCRPSREK